MNFDLILSKLGVSPDMAQDFVFLLAIIFVSFIFGMFIGRYKLVTVLINIYVSLALLASVPKGYLSDYTQELLFFFASLVILTLVSKRLFEIYFSGSGSGFLWRVFAMSFLEVVFLASVTLSIMPKRMALTYISANSYEYLASPEAHFIWMLAPLVFIFMIHKRLNR